ncbi:MAG: hypothetical protein IJ649_04700, partial [Oscillospiraceae bacterium]|nr:hypothetical protein [Oscillospiraceae bacterium]
TKFQMFENVEATDELVAVHNKSISGLRRMLQRGGVPFPSIAIKKAGASHEGFGEVSIVFPRSTIDPAANRWNRLYSNDAWTPTEPATEYEVDERAASQIKRKIEGLVGEKAYSLLNGSSYLHNSQLETDLRSNKGNIFEALKNRSVLKYAYLKSIGQDVELPTREKPLDGSYKYDNQQLLALFDAIGEERLLNGSYEDEALLTEIADTLNEQYAKKVAESDSKAKEKILNALRRVPMFKADKINLSTIQYALQQYQRDGRQLVTETDSYELDRTLRNNQEIETDPAYREWIEQTFGNIVKDSGIPNGKDMYTDSGNLRSFKSRHVPATLENIVQQMRKENERGNGVYGVNLRGAATKTYSSVEEMRADSGKLMGTHVADDVFDSYMEDFNNRLHEMASAATKYPDSMGSYGTARETLLEAVRDAKSKAQMDRMLKKDSAYIKYTPTLADQLWELRNDVQNMPAPYFEAKPRRAVSTDEALAYILPDNAAEDVVQELQNRGYTTLTYKAGDEQDRLAKLNSVEGARFQKWDGDYMTAVENGDTAEAQRLVDQAAAAAGYQYHGYHGTLATDFTEFKKEFIGTRFSFDEKGFFFIDRESIAKYYATSEFSSRKGRVIDAYLRIRKPFVVDRAFALKNGLGNIYRDNDVIDVWDNYSSYFLEEAESRRADGIILDDGSTKMFVVFDGQQIKSAEPVTRDNNGKVIPLSERFNRFERDFRFQKWEEGAPVQQEISSAATSINANKLPVLYTNKNAVFTPGGVNIDVGGGRFDNVTEYLAEKGTTNYIFDPYNRGDDYNRRTLMYLTGGSHADTATCSNCLNVIREAAARANVILECAKAIKPDGKAYFTVYEGDGSGEGKVTKSGWQENRKTASYAEEIGRYF